MNNSLALAVPNLTGSLDAYYGQIREIPVLTAEEEHALAVRLRDHNDLEAARTLVVSNLRFVAHVARGYAGYGLAMPDLVQEGNVGLMKAVKRFNPEVGVRLISFAVHWIRAEIHEFVLRNWRIVKVATTKAQRKLFFNLRSAKKRLGWFNDEEVHAVAKDLGVKPEEVRRMESRLSGQDVGFDGPDQERDDHDHSPVAPVAYLADAAADPATLIEHNDWNQHHNTLLLEALGELDDRSRTILERRWLADKKSTLHELAAEFSVSAERIRQIESNAIKRLKGALAA